MTEKMLVEKVKGKHLSKSIKIMEDPKHLIAAASPVAWKILQILNDYPSYPGEIAQKLKVNEQNIYYHIKKMEKAGLIEVVREDKKQGALCKYYSVKYPSFGIELGSKGKETKIGNDKSYEKLNQFFHEFVKDGVFDGYIVVGSPVQHGPYLTSARDSHYAVDLSMLIGNFCSLGKEFAVKLDTEVKAEGLEKSNLILVGGPVTNIISNDVNEKMGTRFVWKNTWSISSEKTKENHLDDDIGIIAKIKNPLDRNKSIIIFAGLKSEGTKSCIMSVIQHPDKVLEGLSSDKDFFRIVRGLDRDGDGKVDYIQIVE